MNQIARIALAGALALILVSPARAQSQASFTVLSPEDVKIYSEIFQAEKNGQTKRSD